MSRKRARSYSGFAIRLRSRPVEDPSGPDASRDEGAAAELAFVEELQTRWMEAVDRESSHGRGVALEAAAVRGRGLTRGPAPQLARLPEGLCARPSGVVVASAQSGAAASSRRATRVSRSVATRRPHPPTVTRICPHDQIGE